MNDQEFITYVVSYVHHYFRNDPMLLEIVAEAVEHARGIEREEKSNQIKFEQRKDIHPVCHQ
jgi:hypothetical protein